MKNFNSRPEIKVILKWVYQTEGKGYQAETWMNKMENTKLNTQVKILTV